MQIGTVTEIKKHEYRVGLTPNNVRDLTADGASIFVQEGAGIGAGFTDAEYIAAGASMKGSAAEVFDECELIIKVKEPQTAEISLLKPHHTLFTYLHLAPDIEQTESLLHSGATAIAYETVTDTHGRLPLLTPMSEVAGRVAIQAGAYMLQKACGGRGVLLGGVPGVEAGDVLIIGGGVVGTHAAKMAVGLGAQVTMLDTSLNRLRELDDLFGSRVRTLFSSPAVLEHAITCADLVVGAVLIPGAKTPHLVKKHQLSSMRPGAVLVDVAIDQGGCFETSKATTHDLPVYTVDGVQHYCVANMPGATPRTSTVALTNATMPFIRAIAKTNPITAMQQNAHLKNGLNIFSGQLTCAAVAQAQGKSSVSLDSVL